MLSLLLVAAAAMPSVAHGCATLRAVIDGDTFAADIPGRGTHIVRLAGIEAAKRPLEVSPAIPWPLEDASRALLERLTAGQCLAFFPEPWRHDRYQRLLVHVETGSGRWVQGEMLRAGLARVIPGLSSLATTRRLLALESEARQRVEGLWREPYYFVRTPDDAVDFVGTPQLVEGTVLKTARVKQNVYLNFGADWRTDFTVVIPTQALRVFSQAGVQPLQLSGRRIRVRGLVEYLNGPMIEIDDPQTLERLDDPAEEPARRVASGGH
jgi:endonuclease YncB( thermonuclease family)